MHSFSYPGDVYNAVPPRVVFGAGTVAGLADEVAGLGAHRAMVLTTPGRRSLAERVTESLGDARLGVYPEAVSQVPIELAERMRRVTTEQGADSLITVGGGAATGLGKGISLELGLPIINVPTTYAGSEMTAFCGITIDGVKRMHRSLNMLASTVVYDPELTLTLPASTSASSALNALAHCIDGVCTPTLSPLLAPAAVEAARAIFDALPVVVASPEDLEARDELLYGAYLAGGVLAGGFALQHGLAHVLGGSFGVEHGLAHALMLPHVVAYNQPRYAEQLAPFAEALHTENLGGAVFDLLVSSGLPTSLAQVEITPYDLERAVDIAVETADDGDEADTVSRADVQGIFHAAFAGNRPS